MPLTKQIGASSMKRLLVITAAFFLAACAGTAFKWNEARQIKAGMSKKEVTALVGTPNRITTIDDQSQRYVWVWVNTFSGSTRTLVVDFKDGQAIKAPPIPDEFQD